MFQPLKLIKLLLEVEKMNLENLLKFAEVNGANQCELFIYQDKIISTSISIEGRMRISSTSSMGVGIRVIVNGVEGFSYVSNLSRDYIEKSILNAIVNARRAGRKLKSLPTHSQSPHKLDIYHEDLEGISEDELFKNVKNVFDKASKYNGLGRIMSFNSSIRIVKWSLINSLGLNFEVKESHASNNFSVMALKNNQMAIYSDFIYDRKSIDIDITLNKIYESLKYVEKCIPKEPIESGRYQALIGPRALVSILSYTLYPALTSSFHPRILKPGIQLGSENFTLIEDPLNPENPGACPIDHEGTIRNLKSIIEKGTLKTLLYDHYYAENENTISTGNGFRTPLSTWPRLTKPYQATPKPQPRSLQIKHGTKSIGELINQIERGILIEEIIGAHGADPASGRFTVTASLAFKIEDGAITKPIKHATITGNIRELLNLIEASSNIKQVQNTIAPTILIPEINVAGEK